MKYILFAITFFVLAACSQKRINIPDDVIPPDKFVKLTVDMHITDAVFMSKRYYDHQLLKNDINKSFYDALYKKYNISREDYVRSIKFYSAHPEMYDKMYDNVLSKINKRQSELEDNKLKKLPEQKKNKAKKRTKKPQKKKAPQ